MGNWIEEAAERAVRHESIDAVILFGSRARGDAHVDSDWDICMVGSRRPEDIEATMALAEYPDEQTRVDVLWRNRNRLREDTSAGTVWADVVRHGRVVAGDSAILANIEIKPMKESDITRAFEIAGRKIAIAVNHAREETAADGNLKVLISIDGTEASAFAAEQLSRGLLGLSGAQPGSGHDVNKNAEILESVADKSTDPKRADTLRAVANAIRRMNGGTHHARGAAYSGQAEPRDRWEDRIAEVARTYSEVLEGALAATGPLAGLARLPESERIRKIIAGAAETGSGTCRAINEAGTRHLATRTRRALKRWERQWEAESTMSARNE